MSLDAGQAGGDSLPWPSTARSEGPLANTLVVGLEQSVAGPLATRILADLGARVIKVEPPRGDFARHWDEDAAGESAQFWWLNRGKESIQLDLKSDEDRTVFDALLSRADVLVHNMSPAAAARLGLVTAAFGDQHPRLINCQISGYGAETPFANRKAYDMLIQAEAGLMSLTGLPDQPMRIGASVCDITTGIYGAVVILTALLEKRHTGRGRRIDLSMFDVALELVAPMLLTFLNTGRLYDRLPDRHHAIAPYGIFACADGSRMVVAIEHDVEWARFCDEILRQPGLAKDPRYATNTSRLLHREEVDARVAAFFSSVSRDDAFGLLEKGGFAYAEVNDMSSLDGHPAISGRSLIANVPNASGDLVQTVIGICERAFGTHRSGPGRPPTLGEDAERIRREFASASTAQPEFGLESIP